MTGFDAAADSEIVVINESIIGKDTPNSIEPADVGDMGVAILNLLKPFIGNINAFAIFTGTPNPLDTLGAENDIYFQTNGGVSIVVWRKTTTSWEVQATVPLGVSYQDGIIIGLRTQLFLETLSVNVTSGSWAINNVIYSKGTPTILNYNTPAIGSDRIDTIYATTAGTILYIAGAPSGTPVKPNLPANTIEVDSIYVPASGTGDAYMFSSGTGVDLSLYATIVYVDTLDSENVKLSPSTQQIGSINVKGQVNIQDDDGGHGLNLLDQPGTQNYELWTSGGKLKISKGDHNTNTGFIEIDGGKISLSQEPTTDDTPTQILTRDEVSGEVKKVDASRLGISTENYTTMVDASSAENTRNDAGSVIELDNGDLIIAYAHFEDNPDDDGESAIWAARSTDRGQTWGTPFELIPKIELGSYIPSFYKKSNGNILVVYHVLTVGAPSYQSSIYKSEFTQSLTQVGTSTEIYNTGYTAPISDRLYYDEANDRLLFPFAKLVSGSGTSIDSVYEGRFLVSSNEGTSWADAGLSIGTSILNGDGFGGAQEPGFYFDPYKNKTVFYFRTLLGRVYASDLTYSSGYSAGTVYPMNIGSLNATSTIKYWESKKLFIATVPTLFSDPLSYTDRTQIDMLTSVDGVHWGDNNIIKKTTDGETTIEPNIFFDEKKNRVLVSYSKTNGGINFDLESTIVPITNISQRIGSPNIYSSDGDYAIKINRGSTVANSGLIGFYNPKNEFGGFIGQGQGMDDSALQVYAKEAIHSVSGTDKPQIFGNNSGSGTVFGMGYVNNKLLVSTDNRTPEYLEDEANYKGALTVIGETALRSDLEKQLSWKSPTSNLWSIEVDANQTYFYNTTTGQIALLLKNNGTLVASNNDLSSNAVVRNSDLAVEDLTTSVITSATLTSTYSAKPVGFQVICPNISGGGLIYTKSATVWVQTPITITP